jgi:hypothetical protein
MKYTMSSLNGADGLLSLGDIVYLPQRKVSHAQFGQFAKWLSGQDWFPAITERQGVKIPLDHSWFAGWLAMEALKNDWTRGLEIETRPEPEWMKRLPKYARAYIRCERVICGGIDPLAIVPNIPYSGFGYIIRDEGLAIDACRAFNLFRLGEVRQLAFLHDPVLREVERSAVAMQFQHTRYCHVLDTYANARLIGANCGLSERDLNALVTAAVTHDALTPAGGDTTKLVDPKAFDEDVNYPDLLAGPEWEEFEAKWGIDRVLLTETILGKGILGKLLDLADKVSYAARDVDAYLMRQLNRKGKIEGKDLLSPSYGTIAGLIEENPLICRFWDSVMLWNGKVVIADSDRLFAFLKLRALLFRDLYYNPYSRYFEYLIGRGVVKHLYDSGEINKEDLLTYGDGWLEGKIDRFLDAPFATGMLFGLEHSRIEEHSDKALASQRAREFDDDDGVIVIVDDFGYPANPATSRFNVWHHRKVMPFNEARRDDAVKIERLMAFNPIVRVYFFDCGDFNIPVRARRRIKAILKSIREEKEAVIA